MLDALLGLLGSFLGINEVREEPVRPGSCISAYADRRAEQALTDFRHVGGAPLRNRCGFNWTGEIMVSSTEPLTVREAVELWMNSPTHKAVLLKPRAERVGIGRAHTDLTFVIVVNFGDR